MMQQNVISSSVFVNLMEVPQEVLANQLGHQNPTAIEHLKQLISMGASENQIMGHLLQIKEMCGGSTMNVPGMYPTIQDLRIEVITNQGNTICGWHNNANSASCYVNSLPFAVPVQ